MVEPTAIKWLDIQTGGSETFRYAPVAGIERTVDVFIPSQLKPFVVSGHGKIWKGDSITLKGDLGDYIEFGSPIDIVMVDLGNTVPGVKPSYFWNEDLPNRGGFTILKRVSMRVPTFQFRMCGINYTLDWDKFKRLRRIAGGATGQQWGYSREGYPTYGEASLYDVESASGDNPTVVRLAWQKELETPEFGGLCINCPDGYIKNDADECVVSEETTTLNNMWLYGSIGVGAVVLALNAMRKKKNS